MRGVLAPLAAPAIEVFEFYIEYGGLQCVEAEIAADHLVIITRILAVVAEQFECGGRLFVIGSYKAAIAEAAEIFAWEK